MAIRYSRRIVFGERGYQASFAGFKGAGLSKSAACRELEERLRRALEGDYSPLVVVAHPDGGNSMVSRVATVYRTPQDWRYEVTRSDGFVETSANGFDERSKAEASARVHLARIMVPWRDDHGFGLFGPGFHQEHRRHAYFVADRMERSSCAEDGVFGDAADDRTAKRVPARVDALLRKFPYVRPKTEHAP